MVNMWCLTRIFLFLVPLALVRCLEKCAYENCPSYKDGMLNVHLVCHSHDDAGWLKTADQYFWGTNRSISPATVNYVLSSVFGELARDPKRRFSLAEANFIGHWWDVQDDVTRHQFLKLVNQGQIEFVGGGWVQHDEATSHYAALVDQMTLGHRLLNTTLGRCARPRSAWQIDPFGHSRESAALFAQMGLEALFFARIHQLDRDKRWRERSMEFIWRGSDDVEADIFTSVFYEHYMPPAGFCFDEFCNDDPIIDDTRFEAYNVDRKVNDFIGAAEKQAKSYASPHIMMTMGGDFHFSNALAWFSNLDKLIKHVNQRQMQGSKVNVFYSTPTCYARAVRQSGAKLPAAAKTDDFFPYASDEHAYWTGFFSSRPSLKGLVRQTSNLFQVCQSLDAIAQLDPLDWGDVDVLHRSMGLVQHHDGISGTAKQHVTNDYVKQLHQGIMECQQVANDAMKYLASSSKQSPPYHSLCLQLNETVCNVSQSSESFLVTVHNGLSKEYRTVVRIPVNSDDYKVTDPQGEEVEIQVDTSPALTQLNYVKNRAQFELIFPVELPAFGFATYFIEKTDKKPVFINKKKQKMVKTNEYELENELLLVTFDPNSGLISTVTDKRTKTTVPFTQNFFWYAGATRGASGREQSSGAYIFRPNGTRPRSVFGNQKVSLRKVAGEHVQEMRQIFTDWATQRVRLVSQKPYIEFEWTVGPIPHSDNISREIISRFDTNIKSDGLFQTDSNGRQILTRKRNFAPTYTYNDTEPVAANYYPVNTRISIKDPTLQLTVLTDRSQGGSSLRDGSIELMVHRRLLQDDGFGVEEALNETGVDGRGLVATGRHWVLLERPPAAPRKNRFFALELFYQPLLTFAAFEGPFSRYRNQFRTSFSGLTKPLAQNVHVLTVAQWRGRRLLLRLEHIFHRDEDHDYSRPIAVSLDGLFSTFELVRLQETKLSVLELVGEPIQSNFTITLQPMQIRTFLADVRDPQPPPKPRRCPSNRVRDCTL